MKKKILSSILSLCMIVMLLPAITLRASAVYTGGSNVVRTTTLDLTSANADSSSAAEGWSWVQSTKTLILNGVTIQTPSSASGSSYGIELPAGSTITLAGGSINVVSAGDVTESSSGIFFDATSAGTDTINGTGQLFVSGGGTTGVGCSSAGIFTSGTSSLSIADGTVIASSGKASDFSEAIGVHGQLTISNATITATGGLAANSRGIQSDANSITITGGTVTAVGGTATTESIGIIASSSINISNANVNATGGAVTGTTTGTTSSGIWANSVVTISGGKVIATGGSANYRSHGIYGGGSCYFNGGISIARSGIATTLSNAVYASSGFVTFSGTALAAGAINGKYALVVPDTSTLIAAAKTTMLDLSGASADISSAAEGWAWVQSTSTLTLSGVNINASGDTGIKLPAGATIVLADGSVNVIKAGDSTYSYGIYAAGALTINGNGVLTAISGISSCNTWIDLDGSKGVASTAELTIGAVGSPVITAIGGTATDADSMGIYSDEDITITSGTITAVGGTAYCNSYGMIGYNFLSPKNIKITGGTVTATGGATSGFSSYGISSSGNTTIQGGTTYAMGGTAPNTNAWSTGIYSNKDFTISTGVVIATNGYATNRYANFVGGAFTQEGGQVIAISGAADGSGASHSEGIFGRNSCAFNGGTARAYSGTANWSTPVYAETDYAITFSSSVPTYITMPVGGGVSSNGRTIVTAVGGATESTAVRIESVLPTYMMSASALTEFDSQAAGYAAPTAQTVIITNTGNQIITLAQPTSTNYTIGALSASSIAALGTATFTVQPKTGLTVGKYNEDINIAGNGGASTSVSAKFEVTAATTNALTISGGGTGATAGGSYASGANVSISAGTKTGSTFNGWTSSGGGSICQRKPRLNSIYNAVRNCDNYCQLDAHCHHHRHHAVK